jgi:hypothetical protein
MEFEEDSKNRERESQMDMARDPLNLGRKKKVLSSYIV